MAIITDDGPGKKPISPTLIESTGLDIMFIVVTCRLL
jgi:hypothetical protein